MKNPERVAQLLAELRELADNDFERHRIDVLERDLSAPPTVEIIDDTHQKFNGIIYREIKDGHYVASNRPLHRVIWEYYRGAIAPNFVIHHVDQNKANNSIDNLQIMPVDKHTTLHLHSQNRTGKNFLKKKIFVCEWCGKEYEAFDSGGNRFCSTSCRSKFQYHNRKLKKVCAHCGQEFITKDVAKKFCSKRCSQLSFSQNHRVKKICPVCGKEFETQRCVKNETCSKSCGLKLRWQRKHENSQSNS